MARSARLVLVSRSIGVHVSLPSQEFRAWFGVGPVADYLDGILRDPCGHSDQTEIFKTNILARRTSELTRRRGAGGVLFRRIH